MAFVVPVPSAVAAPWLATIAIDHVTVSPSPSLAWSVRLNAVGFASSLIVTETVAPSAITGGLLPPGGLTVTTTSLMTLPPLPSETVTLSV